jgi:hypothetical protein
MLGIQAYEALNVTYVDLADPATPDPGRSDARVLLPDEYYDFPFDLAGQRVAVVGNGVVTGCGREIDGHDVVIRLTSLRHWRRDAVDDGQRLSLWAGQPWRVVEWGPAGEINVLEAFARAARDGLRLWALSPFHISVVAYRWMRDQGVLPNLIVAPTPAVIYDMACEFMSAADVSLLFSIPADRKGIVGLFAYDMLFTGTRLGLLLEMSGVRRMSFYGCDLFRGMRGQLWPGHDVRTDFRVLRGLKTRLIDTGGTFYWHEEESVARELAP